MEGWREQTIQYLMSSLYASRATVERYISPREIATGEFLSLLCSRYEKAKWTGLEDDFGSPDLNLPMTGLQDKINSDETKELEQWENELRAVHRAQTAEKTELIKGQNEVERLQEALATEREQVAAEREELAHKRQALEALENSKTRLKILFEERQPGGLLYETGDMSLERKLYHIKSDYWFSVKSYSDSWMAEQKYVELEQHERTLALMVWPLRKLVRRRKPR